MSATVDTNIEGVILTIDQAAAYLAIPKATLYAWRTRRAGFGRPDHWADRLVDLPASR